MSAEYPDATKCPQCGHVEHTTVCSRCKADKVESTAYAFERMRYVEHLMPTKGEKK